MLVNVSISMTQWSALTPFQAWAWVALHGCTDPAGMIRTPQKELAEQWVASQKTVRQVLHDLEDHGLLVRHKASVWQLVTPSETVEEKPASPTPAPRSSRTGESKTEPKDPAGQVASRLVHQHAARYTERFDQPFLVAWARDTQIYKRLVRVYGETSVEEWQGQYLAQPLDSWSGRCGFSIPQFAVEVGRLAQEASVRSQWTAAQHEAWTALTQAGLSDSTALAVVAECPIDHICEQLQVHRWRQQQGKPVNARRLEQAIREQWAVPDLARPVEYAEFPARSGEPATADSAWHDHEAKAVLGPLMAHITR